MPKTVGVLASFSRTRNMLQAAIHPVLFVAECQLENTAAFQALTFTEAVYSLSSPRSAPAVSGAVCHCRKEIFGVFLSEGVSTDPLRKGMPSDRPAKGRP